jgi:phospholipid N-methyltransferase
MDSFLKVAISSLKTSGTVKPSSKYLIDNCLRDVDFINAKNIIEFGAGDGCITQEIANRMNLNTQLFSFEFNPNFYHHCFKKFAHQPQVKMLDFSALDFDKVLKENQIEQVDFIVSSLPLTLFDEADIDLLLAKVKTHLKPDGHFVQYQYTLGQYFKLKKKFKNVNVQFTFRNIPPAFIYTCKGNL